jgi:hypothetical protein
VRRPGRNELTSTVELLRDFVEFGDSAIDLRIQMPDISSVEAGAIFNEGEILLVSLASFDNAIGTRTL